MKRFYFLLVSAFFSVLALAQEGGGADLNVNIDKGGGGGAGFPWLWVIGALVFVILLVALLGGSRGGSDRVVERKTIIKE